MIRRLAAVAGSLAFLAVVYARVDFRAVVEALGRSDVRLVGLALALEVPRLLASGWRFARLAPPEAGVDLPEACRLTFVGAALNVVLPLKLGDLVKAAFVRGTGPVEPGLALALVVAEKVLGTVALFGWCAVGLAFAPLGLDTRIALIAIFAAAGAAGIAFLAAPATAAAAFRSLERLMPRRAVRWQALAASWGRVQTHLLAGPSRLPTLALASGALWLVQLTQIWLFFAALGAVVPFVPHLGLAGLAVLAGSLPLAALGIGPRDAALVVLYAPYAAPELAAAVAWLCACQYLFAAACGLPFLASGLVRREPGRDAVV